MTTLLYRPVLIESAEQAEALPVGTLAISSEMDDSGDTKHWAAVKVGSAWARTDVADGLPVVTSSGMVDAGLPWTALVPIEAEEETTREVEWGDGTAHLSPPKQAFTSPRTRFVTPWEETR